MIRLLRIFFTAEGGKQRIVLSWLFGSSFAGGIGIATLAPMIAIVGGEEAGESNAISRAVAQALETVNLEPSLGLLLLILVCGVNLQAVLLWIGMRTVGYAVADVTFNYQSRLVKNFFASKWSYFSGLPLGRMTQAISGEAIMCGQAYTQAAQMIVQALQACIYVIIAVLVSWKLALAALLLGAVIAGVLSKQVSKARKHGRRNIQRARELTIHLSNFLAGVKPLKAMERQSAYAALILKNIRELRKTKRRQVDSSQVLKNFQGPLLFTGLALGMYVLIQYFHMPISEVLVVGLLVHRTVRAINGIQKSWQQAALSEHAFTLVASFLEESGAQTENEAGEIAPTLDQGCRFENVSFDYDKSPVLTNVSMEIPARQLTVIIGPSGTGKTTLADLLLGFYEPGKGQILIDGVPLNKINLRSWRHMVGYVPQELFLFRGTILENVTLGDPKLTPEMAEQALKAAEAWDFVAKFPDGMYTHVGEKGTKLSGGERQRVAIARALVHRPKLLILDEATSALDLESEAAICANIQKLSRSITVLAVSHRAGWIDVADQVFELDSQKVDERGGQTGIDLAAQTV